MATPTTTIVAMKSLFLRFVFILQRRGVSIFSIPIVRIIVSKLCHKWSTSWLGINCFIQHAIKAACASTTHLFHHKLSNMNKKLSSAGRGKKNNVSPPSILSVPLTYRINGRVIANPAHSTDDVQSTLSIDMPENKAKLTSTADSEDIVRGSVVIHPRGSTRNI